MRSKRDIATLKRVVQVRDVQRIAAELEAARANAALVRLETSKSQKVADVVRDHEAWTRSLEQGADPRITLGWVVEIDQGLGEIRSLQGKIDDATGERERCLDEWRLAQAKTDAAKAVDRQATRRFNRRREEDQLNDLADQFASGDKRR